MQSFLAGLQRFGIGRLAAVLGAAAGAAAILVAVMLKSGHEPSALLYSSLDLKEAGQITAALDQAGIKYEAKGDGSTLMVPRDTVASTRLMLANKGLPTAGSVGYELFDNASVLGQTDFVQNLNRQRALEGELARTIRSLQGVTSARVHLVLPKRQLFEDQAESPTASIVVGMAGRDMGPDSVRSIRNLVAGAVPDLKPDHVTVIDESGKMLAAGSDDDEVGAAEGRKSDVEDQIRKRVKDLVEGVVGAGNARVQVSADLDMSRISTTEEKYDPDGQVIQSTQTAGQDQNQTDQNSSSATTATTNIPGVAPPAAANGSGSTSKSNDETTNYLNSKTTRTEVVEPGAVKRLSVAVAVDGITKTDKKGKADYTPRSAEEIARIQQLVQSAVGFDPGRKDQVSVVNVQFDRDADGLGGVTAKAPLLDFDKNDLMRVAELAVMGVVGGLLIFFVLRPMLKSAGAQGFIGAAVPALAMAAPMAGGSSPGVTAIGHQGAETLAISGPEAGLDIAKIEGQVRVSSVKKVADFVDRHPDESISILRAWLHDA